MKICTITCHDVYNSGASLQAYALMKYLQDKGNDVEIINYKPNYLSNHYKLNIVANPKYEKKVVLKTLYLALKLPGRVLALKNKKKYDEFREKYLKITEKKYTSNEELKNDPPYADVYICGSDQIWNSKFNNGKDPAFYLDFVPKEKIRAAYAASFATESIDNELKDVVKARINKLNYIGVREVSALDILDDLDIKGGIQVLDPVFLLNKSQWNNLTYKFSKKEKYIFVYDFDGNDLIRDIAIEIARKKNLKIYTVFKSNYADKIVKGMGPIDFITYIKNAEFIISNSFHGTAFSIIFEKQFVVINRKENINTRMRDLLSILEISDRFINKDYDFKNIINSINYEKVNKKLSKKIDLSKNYLSNVLSSKSGVESINEEKDIICN